MTGRERYFVGTAGLRAEEKKVCEYLVRRLGELGESRTTVLERATTQVEVVLSRGLPFDDTFRITATDNGGTAKASLSSATLPGLYAAAGTWVRNRIRPRDVRSTPAMEGRGVYFATHFDVCYVHWSRDQWRRCLEELASWGMNLFWAGYDLRDYHPPWERGWRKKRPEEARMWDVITNAYETARDLGMRTALILCPNMGFRGQADDRTRAKPMARFTGDVARTELCPSTVRGRKVLLDSHERYFSMVPPFEYLLYWPLDAGGCGCDACTPWVGKAYLELCRDSARIARKINKGVRIYVSDTYAEPLDHAMLLAALRGREMKWLDGIVDAWDRWTEPFPCYSPARAKRQLASMTRRVPGSFELGIFPDLSMTFARRPNGRNTTDWGLTGANPLPERFCSIVRNARRATVMMPYSEGIFEDINKATILRSAWDPRTTAETACREYAAAYFPSLSPDTFADFIRLLEANHAHWPSPADIVKMRSLLKTLDRQMTRRERASWRWRILAERVALEQAVAVALSGRKGGRNRAMRTVAETVERLRKIYREPKNRIPPLNGEYLATKLLDFESPTTRADAVDGVDPHSS